jgi:predicted unusual protein kinase regulating ubiquinone biosynthesis (AarF/ABC1/UbiB family)
MLIDTLAELGIKIDPDDIENFKDEMYVIYKQTENYELDQFSFGDTMNTLTSILQRYKIVMPGSFMLMIKVITMIGDVGSQLDPEFDIIGKTTPYLNKLIISTMFSAESLGDAKQAVTREILGFPKAFRRFLENFSSGRSRMEVTVPEFRSLNDGLEYLTQKMVYSVLAVGLMISVALIAPTVVNPFSEWQGYLLWGGLVGLVLAILKLWSQKAKR